MKATTLRRHLMGLLVFASSAFLMPLVQAATITPAMNDLILGFRATANPGQTLDLEVDLGPMSQFYSAAAGSSIPLPKLAVQDLSATFGASWFSRTDLFWGAVATTGRAAGTPDSHAPVGTLWATAPAGAGAFNRGSIFAQKNASAAIEAMLVAGALGTLNGATATANSTAAAVIDATQAGSWTVQDQKTQGTSFGYFNPTVDSVANVPSGGQVVAQLYELQPGSGAGTLLGNLVLTRTGLSFQAPGGGGGGASVIGVTGNLAFGTVTTGTTATATLTITNSGSASLTVSNVSYPAGFSGTFSGSIAAGGSQGVTVTFAPVALVSYTGTVTVVSDAGSGTSSIAVSGTGGTFGAGAGSIGLSGNLAFGTVTTGATATATLTITNSGNASLTVSNITYPAGFSGAYSGTISAGGAQGVTVTFAPVAVTNYGGTVTVVSDASGTSTIEASGTGSIVGAATRNIGLSGNLAFGTVTTGTTTTATLTITNSGSASLTVSNITYPAGFSGAFSGSIAAGGSHGVIVTFAPVAVTNYGGTVAVVSDATGGTSTLAASGAGAARAATRIIGLSGTLSFGTVTMGATATATLTITNTGNSSLTVSSITYPVGFSGTFSGAIPAGGAQGVTVTFAPVAVTNYSGTVTVHSDATTGTSTIAASGTGGIVVTSRIIGLSGNLAFGPVTTGTTATATLTISNSGTAPLTVSSIIYPAGFSGAFSGVIPAGGSLGIPVSFTPTILITYSWIITVQSDATGGTSTIAASGTGTAAATRIMGLSGNLAFGAVTTGTTATATLTISNSGNSPLTVSHITFPPGFSGTFSGTIPAGGSQGVTVTFAPAVPVSYSWGWVVTVHSDATSGPSTIAVSGTGTTNIVNNRSLWFVTGPMVYNAVLSNGTLFVVVADSPALFLAAATDPSGDDLSYRWNFGDGATASGPLASHSYTNSGPFHASVAATYGPLTNTAPLTVSVASQFSTNFPMKVQMSINFATTNQDTVLVQGGLDLGTAFTPAGHRIFFAVGGAQQAFTLDSKGRGVAYSADSKGRNVTVGTCLLTYTKPRTKPARPGFWALTAALSKGTWRNAWGTYGLTNAPIVKPGIAVAVPVVFVIDEEAFMAEPALSYMCTMNKSGQAK